MGTRISDSISSSKVEAINKKKVEAKKQGRTRHRVEYKQQALLRAVKEGIPSVALDLGLEPAQLYGWRAKSKWSEYVE